MNLRKRVTDPDRETVGWYHEQVQKVVIAMPTVAEKVLEETKRFRAALPGLLKTHRGKWVVFKDGVVWSEHDDERRAYLSASKRFGSGAGYVIAPVTEIRLTPVRDAVWFGLA